jgi:SpoVK/Ycf46/Vps4 family AAA+-type ATPase
LRIWQTYGKNLSSVELSLRASAVEVAKYWPLRERFWLDQLSDMHGKDIVFVCGDAHIETFRELLKKTNIESTVEARHIGVTTYDDIRSAEIGLYLKRHPEVFD